jgi:threonine dehydrogenase-like Zn-dependent dehydrogenase
VLHPVPESIPDEAAVFTEPLAAALEITNQVHIRPTDEVVVLGAGKLGLLVAQVLGLIGCDLLVIDHHPENLSFMQARGVATALEPPSDFRADVVVECTGNPSGFQAGRALLKAGGTLVLKSTYHGFSQVDLSKVVVDEIRLVGSRCGPFPAALRLLGSGFVDVGSLIDAVYPLAEGAAALARAGKKGVRKVLLKPGDA